MGPQALVDVRVGVYIGAGVGVLLNALAQGKNEGRCVLAGAGLGNR